MLRTYRNTRVEETRKLSKYFEGKSLIKVQIKTYSYTDRQGSKNGCTKFFCIQRFAL